MGYTKDLTGQTIGNLTLLKRKSENYRSYYLCKCTLCGEEKWIRADSIKNAKSCGCLSENAQFKIINLTGKKFGKLTVIEDTGKTTSHGTIIWKCKCDCGKFCEKPTTSLTGNKAKSCGCLKNESTFKKNIKAAVEVHLEKHIIEGTNVPVITRNKPYSRNTSGVTGVVWDKSRQKWYAQIRFKNKTHYLGRYENKEDAIAARKEAEEKYFKPFLEKINYKSDEN